MRILPEVVWECESALDLNSITITATANYEGTPASPIPSIGEYDYISSITGTATFTYTRVTLASLLTKPGLPWYWGIGDVTPAAGKFIVKRKATIPLQTGGPGWVVKFGAAPAGIAGAFTVTQKNYQDGVSKPDTVNTVDAFCQGSALANLMAVPGRYSCNGTSYVGSNGGADPITGTLAVELVRAADADNGILPIYSVTLPAGASIGAEGDFTLPINGYDGGGAYYPGGGSQFGCGIDGIVPFLVNAGNPTSIIIRSCTRFDMVMANYTDTVSDGTIEYYPPITGTPGGAGSAAVLATIYGSPYPSWFIFPPITFASIADPFSLSSTTLDNGDPTFDLKMAFG